MSERDGTSDMAPQGSADSSLEALFNDTNVSAEDVPMECNEDEAPLEPSWECNDALEESSEDLPRV